MTVRAKRSQRARSSNARSLVRPENRTLERIRAASEGREPSEADFLIQALSDSDPILRRAAAWSLGERREARARPWLEAMVSDATPEARSIAAEALGRIARPESRMVLEGALSDENPRVREQAAWALWAIADPRASTRRSCPPYRTRTLPCDGARPPRSAASTPPKGERAS